MRTLNLLLALSMTACGGVDKLKRRAHFNLQPRTPDEAMQLLSDDEHQQLEVWKDKLLKDCHAADIFAAAEPSGTSAQWIDGKQMLVKLGHSLKVAEGNEITLLGTPRPPFGSNVSSFKNSTSHIEVKRKGSACEVHVSGQKIYETKIFATVPVLLYQSDATEGENTIVARHQVDRQNGQPVLVQDSHLGLDDVLWANAYAEDAAHAFLAKKLEIRREEARVLFMGGLEQPEHSITIPTLNSILPFDGNQKYIFGDESSLRQLQDNIDSHPLMIRIVPPTLAIGDVKNHADVDKNWVVRLRISSVPHQESEDKRAYRMANVEVQEDVTLDDQQSIECFKSRFHAMRGITSGTEAQKVPSFQNAAIPCYLFAKDFAAAVLADKESRDILLEMVSVEHPRDMFYFHEWTTYFKARLLNVLAGAGDFKSTFDPENRFPIIQSIEQGLEEQRKHVEANPQLKPMEENLRSMAVQWVLDRVNNPPEHIQRIYTVLSSTVEFFEASTRKLVSDLENGPDAQEEALAFAEGLTEEYKKTAKDVQELAKSIGFEGLVVNRLKNVLQKRFKLDELYQWQKNIENSRGFINRERERMSADNEATNDDWQKVVAQGFEEDWEEKEFAALETMVEIGRLTPECNTRKTASSVAICLGLDSFSNREEKLFHESFGDRYTQSVPEFVGIIGAASAHPDTANEIRKSFFNPIWASCDERQFKGNLDELKGLAEGLKTASGYTPVKELRNKIANLLNRCP